MHYSDQQLQNLLGQDEGDLVASAAALEHLENCTRCQQRLAQLSGDTWKDEGSLEFVRDTLLSQTSVEGEDDYWQESDDQWTLPPGGSVTQSIAVQVGPSGDWEDESRQRESRVNTDFLKPSVYPDLLGRLGRYDVEHVIGAGGFGIVLKAHDSELRRVVALKVLAPHLMSSVAARQRFAREAQTAAAIVHEHVIPIYDVVSNDEHCYLVMQYIAGESLQERVDRQGPLPVEDVLRIAGQIAAGLDAAHQQGVVHRDVKPANILMEESVNRVLISDFGLARTADDANLTRSGVITGTPHYMSPEQASGSLVDDRSDLFSLGSVMYYMCTGRPPFRAPQIVAVLNRICNHAHRPVSQIQTQIPAPVSDLIDRLLSKDPSRRFRSAAAARSAIAQLLADHQSGKLAAEARVAEKYRWWQKHVAAAAGLLGTVAVTSLLVWGSFQLWQTWNSGETLLADAGASVTDNVEIQNGQRLTTERDVAGTRSAHRNDFQVMRRQSSASGSSQNVQLELGSSFSQSAAGTQSWSAGLGAVSVESMARDGVGIGGWRRSQGPAVYQFLSPGSLRLFRESDFVRVPFLPEATPDMLEDPEVLIEDSDTWLMLWDQRLHAMEQDLNEYQFVIQIEIGESSQENEQEDKRLP